MSKDKKLDPIGRALQEIRGEIGTAVKNLSKHDYREVLEELIVDHEAALEALESDDDTDDEDTEDEDGD